MRRIFRILTAALLATSCMPSAYMMMLDSREPSPSGLDLSGKSVSLIYLESPSGVDTLFNNRLSDVLALGLEKDYFDGERAVDVRRMVKDAGGDYSSKDTLAKYVLDLDSDVVLIVDAPKVQDNGTSKMGQTFVYAYDSMGKDSVYVLDSRYKLDALSASKAISVASSLLPPLSSEWKTEDFYFIYFDSSRKWYTAIEQVEDFAWDKAIETWMEIIPEASPTAQSCAMYNISTACYILGEYELASEWLDRSDETHVVSLSKGMRSRIEQKRSK